MSQYSVLGNAYRMAKHSDGRKQVNCTACGGDGQDENGNTCSACGGYGWVDG